MKSVYSDIYHVAIPTLEYLKAVTGFDMVVDGGWTKEVTEAKVLSLSLRARDYLMTNRSARYQNALSYLIKFDDTWREAWDNFVARYIECTFRYGDEASWQKTPMEIINAVEGSLLAQHRFTDYAYYTIEQSGEMW